MSENDNISVGNITQLTVAPDWLRSSSGIATYVVNSDVVPENTTITGSLLRDVYSVTFYNEKNREIGKLTWPDGVFHFEGNADESARVFFDAIQKWANAWVKG